MSSRAEIIALCRRIPSEVYNQGRLEVIDEIFAPDYVERLPLPPGWPEGREAVKQYVAHVRAAFPDFEYTIESEVVDGDMLAMRTTARGTQTGEFLGIPASGKQATWSEMHFARLRDGQLVEHWAVIDTLSMLQQLGAISG